MSSPPRSSPPPRFIAHSPPPHPLAIARSQLEVVVPAAVVDGVLPGLLRGLVADVPGDLVVDRRSRLVLLDGLDDVLLGGLVDVLPGGLLVDLLQVIVLAPGRRSALLHAAQLHSPSLLRPDIGANGD